ncbi:MAG: hypothetical protein JKY46_05585 [Robiginitomaculum sp.]|nr:hypothetical protein [Robiginitomaculum sp.]
MPKKIVIAKYKDHYIRVENTWFSGASLFIDDKMVDHTNRLIAMDPNEVLLSATIDIDGMSEQIDVSFEVIWVVKFKISIDGKYFAGDQIGSERLPSYQAI